MESKEREVPRVWVMREGVWASMVEAHVVDRVRFDVIPDPGGKATGEKSKDVPEACRPRIKNRDT